MYPAIKSFVLKKRIQRQAISDILRRSTRLGLPCPRLDLANLQILLTNKGINKYLLALLGGYSFHHQSCKAGTRRALTDSLPRVFPGYYRVPAMQGGILALGEYRGTQFIHYALNVADGTRSRISSLQSYKPCALLTEGAQ